VFESLYTKEDLSCFSCFLVEQWDTSIFALDASSRSTRSKLLLLPNRDARAMQVVVLYDTRTAYFIYLLKLARLVIEKYLYWRHHSQSQFFVKLIENF